MASSHPTRKRPIDGLLLVDKPAGVTSHDVITAARRALRIRRVGHAGTLDPFATGLLVLLTGRATRLVPYLDGEPKVYRAEIVLGAETDTDDSTGIVTREAEVPDAASIRAAIDSLTGTFEQTPPAYSAKQVDGVRSYAAARQGKKLVLRPATVTVHGWEIHSLSGGRVDATISCSGGTYIRALARDLGRKAGSAAHLGALRRLSSGRFTVDDAVSLDLLMRAGEDLLRSPLEGLRSLPVQAISDAELLRITRGQSIPATEDGERAVLTVKGDEVVAIAQREGDSWAPRVVLRDA
jgi:tRNA pseudouridine55 synthase